MKAQSHLGRLSVAIAAALIVAGCASQAPLSPSSTTLGSVSRHAGPLTDPSTEVDIANDWTAPIAGTGSAHCWTISPGLPIVGAGDTDGPITLTYTPICPTLSTLPITYRPAASTGPGCTFDVSYSTSGFSFSVVQSALTNCKILYPPNGVSAIFVYNQIASAPKHATLSRTR